MVWKCNLPLQITWEQFTSLPASHVLKSYQHSKLDLPPTVYWQTEAQTSIYVAQIATNFSFTSCCSSSKQRLQVCTAVHQHHNDSRTQAHILHPENTKHHEQYAQYSPTCLDMSISATFTCRTVPWRHWQPGVQFLLTPDVKSVQNTGPFKHSFHCWPGGHILPSPDTNIVQATTGIKDV